MKVQCNTVQYYINNLAKEIINLNLGININNYRLSILLYAEDMVLIANTNRFTENANHNVRLVHEMEVKYKCSQK